MRQQIDDEIPTVEFHCQDHDIITVQRLLTPRVASATLHRLRSAPPSFARPSFELSFALQSAVACCVRFRIHQRHRPPCGGEARRAPIIVFEHPRLEVGRGADVDRVIAAAKDVDTPHRRRSHRRQANSSPSTRFARSGHFSLTAACLSLTAACHERASGLPKARWRRVEMEAAGVEPASENTPSQASTCVAALESSQPPSKSDGNRRPLAPNESRRHPSEPPVTTSLHL